MTMDLVTVKEFFPWDLWQRMLVAVGCGTLVGLDRQLRGKPAGIRTSALIALGTCVFIYLGMTGYTGFGDQYRVLGQVITGIGFLGAGVIMSREGLVTGVTSAAGIWTLAGIGAAAGLGRFDLAASVTIMVLIVLLGVEWLESTFNRLRIGVYQVTQQVQHGSNYHKKKYKDSCLGDKHEK